MKKIKIGGIYQGNLKNLNENFNEELIFLVVREIYLKEIDKTVYEVFKMAKENENKKFRFGIRLINEDGTFLILQPTNNFYLTAEELSKFQLVDEVPAEDIEKILEVRKECQNIDVNCEETRREFEKIKDFHMRIFEIINYI
jgi:hypothetical protein